MQLKFILIQIQMMWVCEDSEDVCENLCAGINISKRSGFCSGPCEVHSEYKYPQRVSNALDVKAERHLYTLGSIVIMAQDD